MMNNSAVTCLSLLVTWSLLFVNIIKSHTVEVCNVVAADGKSVSLYAGTYHLPSQVTSQSGGILLTPPGGIQTRYDFDDFEEDTNESPPSCSNQGVTCDCSRCDSTNSITGKWDNDIRFWFKITVNTLVDGTYEVSTTSDSNIEAPDCNGWSFTINGSTATSSPTNNPTSAPVTPEECMVSLINDFASWYTGDSLEFSAGSAANLWYDESGNNNDGLVYGSGMNKYTTTDTSNELYLNGHPVLTGTTATIVAFFPVLTYQHTVFSVCKYRENGAKAIIIQAYSYNGVFGFVAGNSGVAYEGSWITDNQDQFGNDWVISSQTRSLYRGNKRDLTIAAGTNTISSRLTINEKWVNAASAQPSNFACAEVILVDREFTLDEIKCVEEYLENKYFPDGFITPSPTPQPTLITIAPTLNTQSPTVQTASPASDSVSPTIQTAAPTSQTAAPSVSPTPHPTPTDDPICNTTVKFNINFVIDESNSIQIDDYDEQIRFLQILIYSDVNPVSTVAALEFSHENDIVWNFDDNQGNYRFPIINALEQERNSFDRTKPSMTHTYSALIEAISMFDQTGTIQDPDANLMFLITDGAPTLNDVNGEYPCDEVTGLPTTSGFEIIMKLIEKDIRLYILGIGNRWNTHYKKVECLANDAYIYEQPNFTPEEFELIEEEFRKIICFGEGVLSSN